jgi:hypothetical protein
MEVLPHHKELDYCRSELASGHKLSWREEKLLAKLQLGSVVESHVVTSNICKTV